MAKKEPERMGVYETGPKSEAALKKAQEEEIRQYEARRQEQAMREFEAHEREEAPRVPRTSRFNWSKMTREEDNRHGNWCYAISAVILTAVAVGPLRTLGFFEGGFSFSTVAGSMIIGAFAYLILNVVLLFLTRPFINHVFLSHRKWSLWSQGLDDD